MKVTHKKVSPEIILTLTEEEAWHIRAMLGVGKHSAAKVEYDRRGHGESTYSPNLSYDLYDRLDEFLFPGSV